MGWSHNFSSFVSRRWPLVANIWMQNWISWFYAVLCNTVQTQTQPRHLVQLCLSLFFFFFSALDSYEPELHPAATYRIKQLKATIQVFSTGSITVTGTQRLPVYAEIDRRTDTGAALHTARGLVFPEDWGQVAKYLQQFCHRGIPSFNLLPQGMLSFQAACNLSRDAFPQIAAEKAHWWF